MSISEPAAAGPLVDPVDPVDEPPAAAFSDEPIRTSLRLRPVVHAYFRDRAHEQKISMQKLIESLCEYAYAEWTDQNNARTRRAAAKSKEPTS